MANCTVTKRAVNSKVLFEEITKFIEEGLKDMGVIWSSDTHREAFIELIDEWLESFAEAGRIDQWNTICDFRNNKVADMEQGHFTFDVYYKQHNCLNTTHLRYNVEAGEETEVLEFIF